ncbi:MAG: metal ABC transporter ATP-binding protein [Oscillospiraceae bacterium]|nr:metal ABC transporter ATP-binding protein [Oscillospiraceae bacterium]
MIRAENLYFSYTGTPPYVLDGINLEIADGEYVSVVGENGCGKSTLMRLVLKLIKPTSGTIDTAADKIGYVPQKNDASSSNFPITVYELLNSYRKLLHRKDKSMIPRILDQVKMSGYEKALIGTLSGGQSQKVFIARALMGNPELLILDEPSNGVDLASQAEIYALLKKLNQENGITIVSVEHNLQAAIANSTQIYHLSEGRGHLCSPRRYANEFLKAKGRDDSIA